MLGLQESNLQDCEPAGTMEENSGLYEYNTILYTRNPGEKEYFCTETCKCKMPVNSWLFVQILNFFTPVITNKGAFRETKNLLQ